MRSFVKIILAALLLNCAQFASAQTYTYTGPFAITDNAATYQLVPLTVSSSNQVMNSSWGVVSVKVDITHTAVGDLYLAIISPTGDVADIAVLRGGTSNDYPSSVFNMTSGTAISGAASPFGAGPYKPEGDFGNFNLGQTSTGIWNLLVWDVISGDVGTVNSWSITFGASPATPVLWLDLGCTVVVPASTTYNFYDQAGPSKNYYDNSSLYRTVCSGNSTCLKAVFSTISLSSSAACGRDYLDVFDGTTISYSAGVYIGSLCTSTVSCATAACNSATKTFTSTTGCLTFYFVSNASTNSSGWVGALSNVAGCGPISRPANDDCANATALTTTGGNVDALGCDVAPVGNALSSASNCGWNSTDNSTFYTFDVTSGTPQPVQIDITSTTCSGGGNAMQMALFDNDCSTVGIYGSNYHGCASGSGTVSLTSTTNPLPTGTYMLVIDGQAGSNCTFTFDGAVVLPVSLKSFTLVKEDKQAKLTWITSSETNSKNFEVQRSYNAKDFETLAMIDAKGNTTSETTYDFYDQRPYSGINYYRIVQSDADGKKTYFPLRQIDFSEEVNSFSVYPNPVDGNDLFIDLTSEKPYTAVLSIYDSKGNVVKENTLLVEETNNRFIIDMTNIADGLYFVKVNTPNNQLLRKVIVNHRSR